MSAGKVLLQCLEQTDEFNAGTDMNAKFGLECSVQHRPSYAHLTVNLKEGQRLRSAAGSLFWTDHTAQLETSLFGGCGAAIGRCLSNNSCCVNEWTGPGAVTIGDEELPGDALPFLVTPNQQWMLAPGVYLGSTSNVSVSGKFAGCMAACCSTEGWFLTTVGLEPEAQVGVFFAATYGQIQRIEVPNGVTLCVNQSKFLAASVGSSFVLRCYHPLTWFCMADTPLDVGLPGGCIELCFSGEGVVLKFRGPSVIYTRTRDPVSIRRLMFPKIPLAMQGGADDKGNNGAENAIPA